MQRPFSMMEIAQHKTQGTKRLKFILVKTSPMFQAGK